MKSILQNPVVRFVLAVFLGWFLTILFQFDFHIQYTHVYQTPVLNNSRSFTVMIQPFHQTPAIDLFGPPSP